MPDVFVSHSSRDYETALRLCGDLEASGLTCWIAQRDIHAAETFQSAIVGAVKASAVTLLVFSDNANTSHDVLTELTLARKYKKPIVPVRIEKVEPVDSFEYYLAIPQWTDLFSDWTGGIDRLTTALRRVVGDRTPPPEPSPASPWVPGTVFRDRLADGTEGPEMVVIPAGAFMMGSPEDEARRFDHEGPRHRVTFARPFAIGRFPVTFAEWDTYATATGGYRPDDETWGRARRPVINVSWTDAQGYVRWLAERTGRSYRLPSEAEWECAARAGTTTPYWWGTAADETRANFGGKSDRTTEVGRYPANPWGLSDTAGNVWEWVEDSWHDSYHGAPDDGAAWTATERKSRVLRGGSWFNVSRGLRSADRDSDEPVNRNYSIGFRLARTFMS